MPLDLQEAGGRRLYTVTQGPQVLGFIAIDSLLDGRARGGLRMLPDVSAAELRDAARAMTLKYGFLGLPQGGAKAGVLGDGEAPREEKQARLAEFARVAAPVLEARLYVPDSDLGTTAPDIQSMLRSIGVKVTRREWRTTRSGYYTAYSCLVSAVSALAQRGKSLAGQQVAIEGFGSVGSSLARLMQQRGARVVAVSTSQGAVFDPKGLDLDQLEPLSEAYGSAFVRQIDSRLQIERSRLLELPVDLLCPCARRHGIDETNVGRIAAPLICPGANDPIAPAAEAELLTREVVVLPDFVTNSGGVLGGTMEFAGLEQPSILALFDQFYTDRVTALLEACAAQGLSPRTLATAEAEERHARARQAAEHPSVAGRLFSLGLEAYRKGWIPRRLVALLSPIYMQKLLSR
jgi:glutamate dehydrogenase (NAD(P)+)